MMPPPTAPDSSAPDLPKDDSTIIIEAAVDDGKEEAGGEIIRSAVGGAGEAAEAAASPSAEAAVAEGDEDDGEAYDDGHNDDGPHTPILPSLREVLECQISSWYPGFADVDNTTNNAVAGSEDPDNETLQSYPPRRPPRRRRRRRVTIRTMILDLPEAFVAAYLRSTGTVRLPPGCTTSSILRTGPPIRNRGGDEGDSSDSDSDSDGWSYADSPHQVESQDNDDDGKEELALFDDHIRSAIEELGGSVLPKLNWSAPKDAAWMNAGSLQCRTPGDVYLLLQASDFVSHDVDRALVDVKAAAEQEEIEDEDKSGTRSHFAGYKLALRKWCHLHPSQEFRCFVRGRRVVAISQRHSTSHYPHLAARKDSIRESLVEFHQLYVKDRFAVNPHGGGGGGGVPIVSNYVLDAYVDQRDRVWIVDFNVWGHRTDPLLFTWKELENGMGGSGESPAAVRVVETPKQVRHDPLASYRAPIDAVHVAAMMTGSGTPGGSSASASAFDEFAKLCRRPSQRGDDEDDSASSTSSEEEDDDDDSSAM